MDLISDWLRSLWASCDNRNRNMRSDKQVVWSLRALKLQPESPWIWWMKKWKSPWEFSARFCFGSCTLSWWALEKWMRGVDSSNHKSESYRRVVRVTRIPWGIVERKFILSKNNEPLINLLCLCSLFKQAWAAQIHWARVLHSWVSRREHMPFLIVLIKRKHFTASIGSGRILGKDLHLWL